MAELDLSERVAFLSIQGILPTFSNIVEFSEVNELEEYLLSHHFSIGLLGGRYFLFRDPMGEQTPYSGLSQKTFQIRVMRLVDQIFPKHLLERFGKFLWYKYLVNLHPDAMIRRFFVSLRNARMVNHG